MADFADFQAILSDLVEPGACILAAVSGGADSMALCDLLLRYAPALDVTVEVGHVHHHLRAASDEEWRFVETFCTTRGVRFHGRHIDVLAACRDSRESVEAAAHRLRHAALYEMADACGAHWIALAHHANDRAETVLMHILRGSGGNGLAAMPAVRGRLLRPLLGYTRAEIEAYCQMRGLSWVIDESNADTNYLRNHLRHDIMPVLEAINPNVVAAFNRLADNCAIEQDYINQSAWALFDEAVDFSAVRWCLLRRAPVSVAHPALWAALLRVLCERYSSARSPLRHDMLEQLEHLLCQGRGHYDLGGGLIFECTQRWIYIGRQPEGEWCFRDGAWEQTFLEATLDVPAVFFVRGYTAGDVLYLKKVGKKRVKKIFQETGLPPCLRPYWPIVCNIKTKELIWVPFLAQTSQVMYYNSIDYVKVSLTMHIARREAQLNIIMTDQ